VNLLPLMPLLVVWLVVGGVLTVIDLREHRLPNAITLPMLIVTPLGLFVADLLDAVQAPALAGWSGAGLGAVLWLAVLGLLWVVSRGRGMGLGDVKLGPSLGATLGWLSVETALIGLVASFIIGGLVSLVLLVSRRADRRTAIPFGPFLFAGALVAIVVTR
jgi:leader peptidase (prepilin peptidase)/N-methyltransferase